MLDILHTITKKFLDEALASPSMLADIAALERYNAESYDGKVITELLQNADDALSKKFKIVDIDSTIIFANDGRQFDENDIESISRSGASQKNRNEQIGYRGIGFKSSVSMSNEIVILSGQFCFTFSKSYCSKVLGTQIEKTPTIRIPFEYPYNNLSSKVREKISELKELGYTTFFVFKNPNEAKVSAEVKELESKTLMFLRNLETIDIELNNYKNVYTATKEYNSDGYWVSFNSGEKWHVFSRNHIFLAFKVANDIFVSDNYDSNTVFCFLPTEEISGFSYGISADFSTDPSRKHIIYDDNTNNKILELAEFVVDIIQKIQGYNISLSMRLLDIVLSKKAITSFSTKLETVLIDKLSDAPVLLLKNGSYLTPKNYFLLPDYFNSAEKNIINENCQYYAQNSLEGIETLNAYDFHLLLKKLGAKTYTIDNLLDNLSDIVFSEKVQKTVLGNIHAHIVENLSDLNRMGHFVVPTTKSYLKLAECINESLDQAYLTGLESSLTTSKCEEFSQIFNIKIIKKSTPFERLSVVSEKFIAEPTNHKWRTTEEIAIALEKRLGYSATDVSKQNLGYDIKSVTPSGKSRYVEVKSLEKMGDSFVITNNEYTSAHQHGENYYICLINQKENRVEAMYIQNPIKILQFEKRIRSWEWFCDKYDGQLIELT